MVRSVIATLVGAALLSPRAAAGDTVVLNDGQRFIGMVEERDDMVSVELDLGTISFPRSEVRRIERGDTAIHEFERRLMVTDLGSVAALQSLAAWAEAEGLSTRAYSLHRVVIEIDPNDERSRRALGHVRRQGIWVDPAEEARDARAQEVSARAKEVRRAAEGEALLEELLAGRAAPALPPPAPYDDRFNGSLWGWSWYPGLGVFPPRGAVRGLKRYRRARGFLRRRPALGRKRFGRGHGPPRRPAADGPRTARRPTARTTDRAAEAGRHRPPARGRPQVRRGAGPPGALGASGRRR